MLSRFSRIWLCDPMDGRLPGSSVHGILQAIILEWVAMPFSRRSSQPMYGICISCIADRFFTTESPRTPTFMTLESPVDCKKIQPVHSKGNQSWVFIGRTDVEEVETPILWPHDAESWLIWKDPDAGKDWGQEEKRMTEDEMVGWHHRLNRHPFGWTPAVGDGQGGLACYSP